MDAAKRFGLSAAMCLPLTAAGEPDAARQVAHARRCLAGGCDGVTLFGTTGEGASLGRAQRDALLDAFAASGLALRDALTCGIAASAVETAAEQAHAALDADCRALLVPPPFYFKGVAEADVFDWYAHLFERLGGRARDVILYHIPSVTAVGLGVALVTRLREAFPELIVGVKDSSGDFGHTRALLEAHGDLAILVGDERCLAAGVRLGAQGAISGIANVLPGRLAGLVADGRDDPALVALVDEVLRHPVVPAVKALVAHRTGEDAWRAALPPLHALDPAVAGRLEALLDACAEDVPPRG